MITFIPGTVYKQNAGILEKLLKKNSNLFDHHLHEIFGLHSGTDFRTGPNFPNTTHYNLVASVNIHDTACTAELVLRILENNGLVYKVHLPHFSVKRVK